MTFYDVIKAINEIKIFQQFLHHQEFNELRMFSFKLNYITNKMIKSIKYGGNS